MGAPGGPFLGIQGNLNRCPSRKEEKTGVGRAEAGGRVGEAEEKARASLKDPGGGRVLSFRPNWAWTLLSCESADFLFLKLLRTVALSLATKIGLTNTSGGNDVLL